MILICDSLPGDDVYVVPLARELSIVRGREVRLEASMLRWAGWS